MPSRVLYQFPKPSWIENLAVRSDGDLILSFLTAPEVYRLDPSSKTPEPQLLVTIPDNVGLTGITELQNDVFYAIATTNSSLPYTYSLWEVKLSGHSSKTKAFSRKLVDIPEAGLLNSIIPASSNSKETKLLISDATLGLVWQVDTTTGAYSILLDYPEMKLAPGASVAINGIKLHNNFLYFSNSGANTFNRIALPPNNHAVQTLANVTFIDDFIFDTKGTAWLALDTAWEIATLEPGQMNATVVLGAEDALTVAGPTAVQFGRGGCEDTLYVVTNGGFGSPRNGTYEGAKVLAVDTRGYRR